MPIKLGFIGLSAKGGWASFAHVPALTSSSLSSQYVLTAVSATSQASAAASAEKYGSENRPVTAYHGDTEAIANDANVDMIAVTVKAPDHMKAVMPAIKRGKNVFVEWPLGNGLQEAREMAKAAREKGVRTMVGAQSWQVPVVRKVKAWIDEDKIGKVTSSTWVASKAPSSPFFSPWTTPNALYSTDPKNGATYVDIFVGHNLSLLHYALGPLQSLSATTAVIFPQVKVSASLTAPDSESQFVPAPAPDQYALTGTLANSGAILTATWRILGSAPPAENAVPSLIWVIDGTAGQIRVESSAPSGSLPHIVPPDRVWLNGELIDLSADNAAGGSNVARAWGEFAKGEGGVYPTFDDAVKIQEAVEAVKRSAKEGKRVEVGSV